MGAALSRSCLRGPPRRSMLAAGVSLVAHLALLGLLGAAAQGGMNAGAGREPAPLQLLLRPAATEPEKAATPTVTSSGGQRAEEGPPPAREDASAAHAQAAVTPSAGLPLPEPRYYRPSELSLRPQVVEDLPESFAIEGVPAQTVILRLFIDEQGRVDRVEREQSYLPEQQARLLVDAFERIRFAPGRIGAEAVKSQMRIEVRIDRAPPPPA